MRTDALWRPGSTVKLADSNLHCFGTAPEIVTPAEDFKVAARTLRHYVDSAGTSGKKEGVIDTVAGLPALRFRHVVFKVCFSQVF
jgi:hypothetical protein